MRKSILILSSFLLLAGCVGEENLDYDKTWNEDFDYTVDEGTDIEVPGTDELTDTIDLRIFDAINLDYPGLEKVKEAYEAGKLYAETHPDEEEGEGTTEGDGTGEGASEGKAAAESKASDEVSDEGPGDKDGYYKAAAYLLEYFRNRTNVSYPQIEASLINATYTDNEKTIADKALDGHFYVRNCAYTDPEDSDVYIDFPDFGLTVAEDGTVTINWGMEKPADFAEVATQEWNSQQHRHQWMLPEAKVYRATGDERYCENWKMVYRNWVDKSPIPEGAESSHVISADQIRWYGLQPAERLRDQVSIFYYFLDSENFTPGWISFFLSEFAKTANIINSNPYGPAEEGHNITLAQNQALFYASILFPEFKNAGSWEEYCTANLATLNETVFLSDGGPVERDPSYHLGNVSNFYDIMLIANANNKTLPGDFVKNLEGGCEFMVDITYPGYTVDNFNDTRSDRMTRSVLKRNFGYYYEMFPENNKFRYMYTERKDGTEPSDLVQIYPETGYYMLRTGWEADDAMMVVKNNPDGEWHCQYDNLTFGIYRNGISFSPDAGSYSYDSGGDRETYAAAGMHNVMIKPNNNISNGVNFDHESRTGEFLGNGSGRNYEWIAAQNANYPDLTHRRAVFMVNREFFVLMDEGYGSYEGLIKLLFKGGNPEGTNASRDSYIMDNCQKNGNEGDFDPNMPAGMHTTFSGSSNMLFTTFPATTDGYDSNWTTGYFSNETATRVQRRNYEICQNKSADDAVRFITVIFPYGAAAEYDSLNIFAEFRDNGFSQNGASVRVTVDKAGEQTVYNLSYTL